MLTLRLNVCSTAGPRVVPDTFSGTPHRRFLSPRPRWARCRCQAAHHAKFARTTASRYGNTAVASISTFASASMSATTCTTLITGKCFPITAR